MAVLKRNRLLRVLMALLFVGGFAASLSAYEATFEDCVLNCGGGCIIVADNCDDCWESSPEECTIYWNAGGCDTFACSGQCPVCEVFES